MATTITPTIVNVNVSVVYAPAPSQLQQSGAIVSAGGTNLAANAYIYLGSATGLSSITATPLAITSLAWSGGTVTATVAAETLTTGQVFTTIISGAVPAAYNGTYTATVASTTTFTFPIATNPGAETTPGTYTPPTSAFVIDAVTQHFAQGSAVGVYVLELGQGATATADITNLGTWLTNNPGVFYALELPPAWDGSALATLANTYSSPNSKLYFFVTTTQANLTLYAGNKAVFAVVPYAGQAATEIQCGAFFYQWLANAPSAATPARQMNYRYIYGVTPWPYLANLTAINTILTAFGNIVYPASEGGVSTSTIRNGTTMDGSQAMFWYAVDWFSINAKINLANAIINGSNSNNPLYYNQTGINALLTVAQDLANTSVSFGLNLTAVVTATPFQTFINANPADYAAGIYNGFAATITPQNGFTSITFAIAAVEFA